MGDLCLYFSWWSQSCRTQSKVSRRLLVPKFASEEISHCPQCMPHWCTLAKQMLRIHRSLKFQNSICTSKIRKVKSILGKQRKMAHNNDRWNIPLCSFPPLVFSTTISAAGFCPRKDENRGWEEFQTWNWLFLT